MNTKELADRLVALCRQADFEKAQKELFADEAVSIEPCVTDDFEKETKGLPAILKKGHKFMRMVEIVHSIDVSEPLVAAQCFACVMRLDATLKGKGRMDMTELCVYEVKDGKIVSERFYA